MTNIQNSSETAVEEKAEFWDLFDRKGNFVRKMQRGQGFVPPELYHQTVEIIATDFKGHILVTQRSLEKKRDAGFWEFPAGSVLSGEEPHQAAIRELEEETGLRPDKFYNFHKVLIPGMMRFAYFAHVPDLLTAEIRLQEGETMNYRIVTVAQWQQMLSSGMFSSSRMRTYTEKFYRAIEKYIGIIEEPPKQTVKPQKIRKVKFGEE